MQILLADSKTMIEKEERRSYSIPLFQSFADELAGIMSKYNVEQLMAKFHSSQKLAEENKVRYQNYSSAAKLPAIFAYRGQAYKHLGAESLSDEAINFGQNHLWITSFLYGLLRPMDGIVPYRIYPNVFWKDILTDKLIQSVNEDGGILVHLSTEEYESLFDWKRVIKEIQVVKPSFYVRAKNGSLKIQAVWAKTCRGAMVRFILQNRIENIDELKEFKYEGFSLLSDTLCFVRK